MESDKIIEKVMAILPQAQSQGLGAAELMALSKREGGGFGEGGGGVMMLILLLALLGRGNGGLFGGGNDSNGVAAADLLQNGVTRTDLSELQASLTSIREGQFTQFANATAALNAVDQNLTGEINRVSSQLAQCCCNIERSIDRVSTQLAQEACATREAIRNSEQVLSMQATHNQFANQTAFSELRFQSATDKAEILRAGENNTSEILSYLRDTRAAECLAENVSLKAQISQANQTAAILAAIQANCGAGNGNGNAAIAGLIGK